MYEYIVFGICFYCIKLDYVYMIFSIIFIVDAQITGLRIVAEMNLFFIV